MTDHMNYTPPLEPWFRPSAPAQFWLLQLSQMVGTSTTTPVWKFGLTSLVPRSVTEFFPCAESIGIWLLNPSDFCFTLSYYGVLYCLSFMVLFRIFQVRFQISNMVCFLALGIHCAFCLFRLSCRYFSLFSFFDLSATSKQVQKMIEACFLWLLQSHVNVWNGVIISMIKYYGTTMDDLGLDHLQYLTAQLNTRLSSSGLETCLISFLLVFLRSISLILFNVLLSVIVWDSSVIERKSEIAGLWDSTWQIGESCLLVTARNAMQKTPSSVVFGVQELLGRVSERTCACKLLPLICTVDSN